MSTYAAPDAVGLGGGMPPGAGGPPAPGDPGSMAALAALLQGGGTPGGPDPTAGGAPPPGAPDLAGLGGATPGGPPGSGDANSDLLTGMSSTDHIRSAIKHLMMAMTESTDDEESAGITKGMAGLHQILAGKAKNAKTVAAAGG